MGKRIVNDIFAAAGILLLILDSRTALLGAQSAVELCISSVIPSLFPFLVLSGMLTAAINRANLRILRPLGHLLGIPAGTEGIFITGILGGYPTGAQAVHQAWSKGQLSREEATRMLAFCSNAGPAFLFGILGTKFTYSWIPWLLWGIHILSAIAVAVILPAKRNGVRKLSTASPVTVTQALKTAVVTMGYICGWIILMRVILAFLDRWVLWLFPTEVRICFYGFIELTNGCCDADAVSTQGLRFILCSAMLAFGGICVAMQTASVTGKLGIKQYLKGKTLQTIISFLLSATIQLFVFESSESAQISPILILSLLLLILLYCAILRKNEKKSSIPALIVV